MEHTMKTILHNIQLWRLNRMMIKALTLDAKNEKLCIKIEKLGIKIETWEKANALFPDDQNNQRCHSEAVDIRES